MKYQSPSSKLFDINDRNHLTECVYILYKSEFKQKVKSLEDERSSECLITK